MPNHNNKFYKMDLHHHTRDVYEGDGKRDLREEDFDCFFQLLKDKNVKVISFTNHNFIDFDQFRKFNDFIREQHYKLLVFPGIELKFRDDDSNSRHDMEITFDPNQIDILEEWYNDFFGKEHNEIEAGKYSSNPKHWREIISNKKFLSLNKIVLLPNKGKNSNKKPFICEEEVESIISFSKQDSNGIFAYEANDFWNNVVFRKMRDSLNETPVISGSDNLDINNVDRFDFVNVIPFLPNDFESIVNYLKDGDFRMKFENRIIESNNNSDESNFFQKLIQFAPDISGDTPLFPIQFGFNLIMGEIATGKTQAMEKFMEKFSNLKKVKFLKAKDKREKFSVLTKKREEEIRSLDSLDKDYEFYVNRLSENQFKEPNFELKSYVKDLKKFYQREKNKRGAEDWKDKFLKIPTSLKNNVQLKELFLDDEFCKTKITNITDNLTKISIIDEIDFHSIRTELTENNLNYSNDASLENGIVEIKKFVSFFKDSVWTLFWNYKKKNYLKKILFESWEGANDTIVSLTKAEIFPEFGDKLLDQFYFRKEFINFFLKVFEFSESLKKLENKKEISRINSQKNRIFYRQRELNFLGKRITDDWPEVHGNKKIDPYNTLENVTSILLPSNNVNFILSIGEIFNKKIFEIVSLEKEFLDYLTIKNKFPGDKPIKLSNLLGLCFSTVGDDGKITELSDGQCQIIMLKDFIEDSTVDILILDEPEASLDNGTFTEDIIGELLRVNLEKKIVIIISHNSNLYFKLHPNNVIYRKYSGSKEYITYLSSYYNREFIDFDNELLPIKQAEDLLNRMEGGKEVFKSKETFYNKNE
ncbi:hypothetical protein [Mesoplasma whartonense]|uniref:hypothetical protein n=1 Tax=Mesoplasma whartonense TaxID=2878854 RepID=UPI002022A3A7|nr:MULTISPECIES: hypothetical protein [unclassified Mesoplasma]MCL8212674.1 hypothetical protein [Mesoplasma sp. JKS002661]MCL8216417.1 hypothetical protein [Mesoplasma sp. JKS002657]